MEEREVDYLLVPLGVLVLGIYHVWLLFTIIRHPSHTVIGLNAQSRYQWVLSIMADPLKNGVLGVQTIRNNIMASTLLATTAITLSSLIGVFANYESDTKYYAQVSFLITTHALKGQRDFIEYAARSLNRGSYAWSLGLRAFYFSFPLVLWIYGPIPMFACSCLTSFILYFLDTTTQITRDLHTKSFNKRETGCTEGA
ncbi:hypothetical protein PHAVU_002G325700 [Phaseolus vulgaris]|uniref:uncharacterized protein isoform X2 n=1 Tax=Phaseolus vulgaris TaxID=3885 RepID=UPI0035CA5D37